MTEKQLCLLVVAHKPSSLGSYVISQLPTKAKPKHATSEQQGRGIWGF
jgi:hypothetical protein